MILALMLLSALDNSKPVDFQKEIRPLFSKRCLTCHGPDESSREAELRLDTELGLFGDRGGYAVVVPGNREDSELWYRITSDEDRMPPDDLPGLKEAERELLGRWVDEGADWGKHWSYEVPVRAELPDTLDADWTRNPVDAFVLARLESEGLEPSSEATPEALARRAALDLTGLPPEVKRLDAFLSAWSSDKDTAWSAWLDELLDAPAHAEHLTAAWLDLARYADSNGYEKDDGRTVWSYRDWVLAAFDSDLPFDEFTRLQLAGDLVPGATQADLVATGFHRNTMTNLEGGTDPEEFRVAAVLDRVDTTGVTWLGTTMGCAKCHSHRYDPISHEDYYSLFAFFNGTADTGNSLEPTIAVPSTEATQRLAEIASTRLELLTRLNAPDAELDERQSVWEDRLRASLPEPIAWEPLHVESASTQSGASLEDQGDGSWKATGPAALTDIYELLGRPLESTLNLGAIQLEALPGDNGRVGRTSNGNFVLTEVELEIVAPNGTSVPVAIASARSHYSQRGADWRAQGVIDGLPETGWAVGGGEQRTDLGVTLILAKRMLVDAGSRVRVRLRQESKYGSHILARVRLSTAAPSRALRNLAPVQLGRWLGAGPFAAESFDAAFQGASAPESEVRAGLDPFRQPGVDWSERVDIKDGVLHPLEGSNSSFLFVRELQVEHAQDIVLRLGSDDGIKVWLNGGLLHSNPAQRGAALDQDEVVARVPSGRSLLLMKIVNGGGVGGFTFLAEESPPGGLPAETIAALEVAPEERTEDNVADLRLRFRREQTLMGRESSLLLDALEAESAALHEGIPTTPVMRELAGGRETHVLFGANYLTPSVAVTQSIPAAFGVWPEKLSRDRLGLSEWLTSPQNPLTARVVVNRAWARIFGTGLVGTVDDFGAQGEQPSHPKLLDWLAVDFRESGWDFDHLYRTILSSATYRQASQVSEPLHRRDPANRLLARGPRFRLSAEGLRDVALASAGLLDRTIGGPSVFPPQPEGTWAMTYSGSMWVDDKGPNRWRRGMYTFRRRTAPYPTFALMDAPSFEVSCTSRSRTNTPLQALALLNDPVFVEAAGGLARLVLSEMPDAGDVARIDYAFRRCTSRRPSEAESRVLSELLAAERNRFTESPDRAAALVASEVLPGVLDPIETASWTLLANVLLNLDEVLTKE
jgi:hypothetical protein